MILMRGTKLFVFFFVLQKMNPPFMVETKVLFHETRLTVSSH